MPAQEPTSPRASKDGKPPSRAVYGRCTRGELTPDTDPDTLALALLSAPQGGLLPTKIKRDTKPLVAALDALLELVARVSSSP